RPEPTTKYPYLPFEHGTPDGYKFFLEMGPLKNADTRYFKGDVAFWNEVMSHGNYDAWWQARNIRAHVKNIKPAVLTVGRWFDAWPPKEAKAIRFGFDENGMLHGGFENIGMHSGPPPLTKFDEFISDPAKPVPFINKTGIGMLQEYMTADQRFASQRPDVLVYQTPVLDKDLTIVGPIEVELYVSTTG